MKERTLLRYTPPTCTLEVVAAESALSRWTGQSVLKNLRFQLSFDDPRLPSHQRVLVRGDRTQLEALSETVTTYVQQFLAGDGSLDTGRIQVQDISLQPKGLLNHTLNLGSLAAGSTRSTVQLSTLQLSDLAAALDEYGREAVALPTLNRSSGFAVPSAWLRTAAVVLVTVGLTATTLRLLDRRMEPVPTTASNPQAVNDDLALEMAPASPPPAAVPPPAPPIDLSSPTLGGAPRSPALGTAPVAKATPSKPPAPVTQKPQPAPPGAIAIPAPPAGRSAPGPIAVNPSNPLLLPPIAPSAPPPSVAESQPSLAAAPTNRAAARMAPTQDSLNQSGSQPASSTAFDTVPQIAEARAYFQQRWQPPQGLTQTLEYSLLVNSDGAIERIIPLGQSAATYVDQTGMPRAGEPFVSPVAVGSGVRIRVVLSPNGKVQTFQE